MPKQKDGRYRKKITIPGESRVFPIRSFFAALENIERSAR